MIHLRVARPTNDLRRTVEQYLVGLALEQLGSFEDHAGFDGVMLGIHGAGFHLEFTYCRTHPVVPRPNPEDLLVVYVPEAEAWECRCIAMRNAGFKVVGAFNPYWEQRGCTFEDRDGYRVVIQRDAWVVA